MGNLRTAMLSQRFADEAGIGHLIRVEDLDQRRVAAARGVANLQLADLTAVGVRSDIPVVWQSDRLDGYREALTRLETYPCFCTRRDIAEASQAPHDGFRAYPGTCADLTPAEREERARTRPPALRVRAESARQTVHDRFAGEVTGVVDDFVVVRNDGTPAYNLAVVVDDARQGVTQVTRGRDLLESAPRQAWLATRLGHAVPEYVHVGLVVNTDGVRLAKRDGAVTAGQLVDAAVVADRSAALQLMREWIEPSLADPSADAVFAGPGNGLTGRRWRTGCR